MEIDDAKFYRGDEFDGHEDPRYSDREFIESELKKLPFWARSRVLSKYSLAYSEGLLRDDVPKHMVVNLIRKECNLRLRQAVVNLTSNNLPPHQP